MSDLKIEYNNKVGNLRIAYTKFIELAREEINQEYMDENCVIHIAPSELREKLDKLRHEYIQARIDLIGFKDRHRKDLLEEGILSEKDFSQERYLL